MNKMNEYLTNEEKVTLALLIANGYYTKHYEPKKCMLCESINLEHIYIDENELDGVFVICSHCKSTLGYNQYGIWDPYLETKIL